MVDVFGHHADRVRHIQWCLRLLRGSRTIDDPLIQRTAFRNWGTGTRNKSHLPTNRAGGLMCKKLCVYVCVCDVYFCFILFDRGLHPLRGSRRPHAMRESDAERGVVPLFSDAGRAHFPLCPSHCYSFFGFATRRTTTHVTSTPDQELGHVRSRPSSSSRRLVDES